METIFKVGDKVFDIRLGWGEVVGIKRHIEAIFCNDMNTASYHLDGSLYDSDLHPTLSFTEYTLQGFSQERPKKEPEIGSFCLFSDYKSEFKENFGSTGILTAINKAEGYKRNDRFSYIYCKQIEIKDV